MANTPYQTTDALKVTVGTQYDAVGFYGTTGIAGPQATTASTAGTDAVATSLQAALVALGLIK